MIIKVSLCHGVQLSEETFLADIFLLSPPISDQSYYADRGERGGNMTAMLPALVCIEAKFGRFKLCAAQCESRLAHRRLCT